jgi:IS605 OrfB family transposase
MTTTFVYRFKLEPTPEQERGLSRLAGARRFILNWALARRRAHYAEHRKTPRYTALNLELTALKQDERSDFLHKTTTALAARRDLICIEDLSVKGLSKTKLGKSIFDAAFGEFRRRVEYKAAWNGKRVSVIGRFYPSSKLHRTCGTIKADLTLADRDKNAAENILAEGLSLVAAGQADRQNAHGASVRLAERERRASK